MCIHVLMHILATNEMCVRKEIHRKNTGVSEEVCQKIQDGFKRNTWAIKY